MPNIDMRAKFQCLACGGNNAHVTGYGSATSGNVVDTECPDCKAIGKISNMTPWYGTELKETEVLNIMELAGIKVLGTPYALMNEYHSGGRDRNGEKQYWHPWWLVKTQYGFIKIGWRKRVIHIEWTDTPIRAIVTEDELTKDPYYVHAYSITKAVEYLTEWNKVASQSVTGTNQ